MGNPRRKTHTQGNGVQREQHSSYPQEKRHGVGSWGTIFLLVAGFGFLSLFLYKNSSRNPLYKSWHSSYTLGPRNKDGDPSLEGFLPNNVDRASCRSRASIHRYRRASKYKPSEYLVSRLRNYEAMHGRCAPGSESFKNNLELLKSGQQYGQEETDCRYLIWIAYCGLGNRIVSIVAAFVYALLTNRIILLDRSGGLDDLFCEPFPNASWFLPQDFPVLSFRVMNETSPYGFGTLLNSSSASRLPRTGAYNTIPVYTFVSLTHIGDNIDSFAFCDGQQDLVHHIPWLFLKSNLYFVPSLYLLSSHFKLELDRLFPEREALFHHVVRYLFHPTNHVWDWITRFHKAYLSSANEKVGIQVRNLGPYPYAVEQILNCAITNNILPNVTRETYGIENDSHALRKVVLLTSLERKYFDHIKDLYLDYGTDSGDIVVVHQPSYESFQQTDEGTHNKKAWAEICLLSLSDKLITSAWSTFGYVAQGLSGAAPWILTRPRNMSLPDPTCKLAKSPEPCLLTPPTYNCEVGNWLDASAILPFVKHCEDVQWGIKILEGD